MLFRVGVFGHSFVRNLKRHLGNANYDFSLPLGLSKVCQSVSLIGESGACVDAMVKFFCSIRGADEFDFIVIDIGTNDLCGNVDGRSLAQMVSLARD